MGIKRINNDWWLHSSSYLFGTLPQFFFEFLQFSEFFSEDSKEREEYNALTRDLCYFISLEMSTAIKSDPNQEHQ